METIPLSSIIIGDRQRQDLGDIASLAASLATYGLIQPIVLDDANLLIAGRRRLAAATMLGWMEVPVVRLGSIPKELKEELELEEDIRRKDRSWQELATAILRIHNLRKGTAAASSRRWGYEQTGAILGLASSNVWYPCTVAALLPTDEELRKCPDLASAIRLLLSRKEQEAARLLAAQIKATPTTVDRYSVDLGEDGTPLSAHSDAIEIAPSTPPDADTWIKQRCHFGDALEYMHSLPKECIDHIYTDPPYGIDMDNLNQEGSQSSLTVERVRDTHQVLANINLLGAFLTEASRILRPTGFCVLWCDQDNWQFLIDTAKAVGFSPQRWPLHWVKSHAKNEMAYHNFTKTTECAMLLRKSGARLLQNRPTSHYMCNNDKEEYNSVHPFWKPIALHQWILTAIAQPGSTVFDPFAGEGSIPVACMKSGMNFLAAENTAIHYVQLIENVRKLAFPT